EERMAVLERKNETTEQRLQDAERTARQYAREKALIQLEAENYVIDRADELAFTRDFSDPQFDKYLAQLRKNGKRAPVGDRVPVQTSAPDKPLPTPTGTGKNGKPAATRDQMKAALDYEKKHKVSYEQALEAVTKTS